MSGLQAEVDSEACADRLEELRDSDEPYAIAISRHLALDLPDGRCARDLEGRGRALRRRSAAAVGGRAGSALFGSHVFR